MSVELTDAPLRSNQLFAIGDLYRLASVSLNLSGR